jgi:hypothetical protein
MTATEQTHTVWQLARLAEVWEPDAIDSPEGEADGGDEE